MTTIERIETRVVHAESRNWVFVIVRASDGLAGLGEATLEWKTRAVTGCVQDLAPLLVGRESGDVVALWDEMVLRGYYPLGSVVATALSGIDQALWDIAGKRAGVPAWRLLGTAARDRLESYVNLSNGETSQNGFVPDSGAIRDAIASARAAGFTAVKWKPVAPGASGGAESAAVRSLVEEAIAAGVSVALDVHGRLSGEAARALVATWPEAGWERFAFLEEPCRPEDRAGWRRLRAATRLPLATGERLSSRFPFRDVVSEGIADVLQPDVCRIGGLTEAARLAREFPRHAIAPHCPLGPVALAASVHLGFSAPNVLTQEYFVRDAPWRDDVIAGAPRPVAGAFAPPEAPGLGVSLDERAAAAHPFQEVSPPRPADSRGRVLPW